MKTIGCFLLVILALLLYCKPPRTDFEPNKKESICNVPIKHGVGYDKDEKGCQLNVPDMREDHRCVYVNNELKGQKGGVKASRNIMKSNYKQLGGTCLLASYAFLLEYANVFQSGGSIQEVYDVFAAYLRFHNTLEPIACLTAEQIKEQGREAEKMIGKAINSYCFAHGHVAGYQQIKSFHQWLINNSVISNVEILSVMPPVGAPRSEPITDVYQTISDFLKKRNDQEYYGALILYLAGEGAHTVFLGYDGDFFIRDSNYSGVMGNKASFDFTFNAESPITEYMLFRIRK